jgi:hypothetical protein
MSLPNVISNLANSPRKEETFIIETGKSMKMSGQDVNGAALSQA